MANLEVKDQVNVTDFDAIQLSVASPEDILTWSHGEVLKPETINYRTQKPERDGLFCEKIFGPTKDWECYCGKYRKIRYKGVVCDKCGVEVTRSSVRRVRLGHIDLAVPVAHIWYSKGASSTISMVLNMTTSDLEKVVYFASFAILSINEELRNASLIGLEKEYKEYLDELKDPDKDLDVTKEDVDLAYKTAKNELGGLEVGKIISEQIYHELNMKYGQIIEVGIGAEAILKLLKNLDLSKEIEVAKESSKKQIGIARGKALKRLRALTNLKVAKIEPSWLILTRLPVIPPDLRPMVQLDGGRFAASDLNDLYRRVLNRNNRLKRLISQGAPEVICRNEKRMLQEAVDALIDNSARKGKVASSAGGKRKLRSLSDMLRGKQGRFRQNLLGKRVDYSGRSVIVVGPKLKLNQCGLPKIMALELFKPFVIGRLISDGYVHNVKNATRLIEKGEPFVWDILEEIIKNRHVLLNRAPTLHRLGIQAFQPVLIEGKAIQIHPLVCAAFNADFDGDQMAVHVPLSDKAQEEAGTIMLSANNLLKPASGDPVVTPSYDMILGSYYITKLEENGKGAGMVFSSENEAISTYDSGNLGIGAKIKVRLNNGEVAETSVGRILFNEIIPDELGFINDVFNKKAISKLVDRIYRELGTERTAQFVDDLKDIGFKFAQKSGLTFAVDDIHVPSTKSAILKASEDLLAIIDKQYQRGLITDEERYAKTIELWMDAQSKIEKDMMEQYSKENDLFIVMTSGARGNVAQMIQVAGMKGLVADTTGEIIELPIKSNFKEGLSVFEYFVSTHGSRKGRADTALRTSEAGYLTRRLVDVSQDTVILEDDCGTTKSRTISRKFYEDLGEKWDKYVIGRVLAKDVAGVKANSVITAQDLEKINTAGIEEIEIFSLLGCQIDRGVCKKCYGLDLATGKIVEEGATVGIVAAQAIGEPGTQLTMRTFHTGGAAGEDITSGLPRVEEIFEARTPKKPAVLSEVAGKATIRTEKDGIIVTVVGKGEKSEVVELPEGYSWVIQDGEKIKTKQIIAELKDDAASTKGGAGTPTSAESGMRGKPVRSKVTGEIAINGKKAIVKSSGNITREYSLSKVAQLKIKDGEEVEKGQPLTEGHFDLASSLKLAGRAKTQNYIIKQVQMIYESQGQDINDKHVEVIVRLMLSKVKITSAGNSSYLAGQVVNRVDVDLANEKLEKAGKKKADYEDIIMGITRVALKTESFLSAASFQETTSVLIEAATSAKIDRLRGLKENVIIGKLIPAGTGLTESAR
ncbi:MAG: DNA-directed RNA polymerase subunit beta', partial [Patescibacteria group bacterium]|nr:DNA-directed RNA polymerase subunit beta' [Patescibacteria group bacterium]